MSYVGQLKPPRLGFFSGGERHTASLYMHLPDYLPSPHYEKCNYSRVYLRPVEIVIEV